MLFSWEEGASHWYQGLTWKIFWTSISSIFVLRIYLAGTTTDTGGKAVGWGNIGSGSLVDFGNFEAQDGTCGGAVARWRWRGGIPAYRLPSLCPLSFLPCC